jgi:hypothetical protein
LRLVPTGDVEEFSTPFALFNAGAPSESGGREIDFLDSHIYSIRVLPGFVHSELNLVFYRKHFRIHDDIIIMLDTQYFISLGNIARLNDSNQVRRVQV